MKDRHYTRAHAEAILRVAFANDDGVWRDGTPPNARDQKSPSRICIDQRGVWPNFGDDDVLGWKPCWEMVDLPNAPDCGTTAGLPFPFTEYQLAAWMQRGVGALVASCFGPWEGGGPDTSVLNHPEDNKAREAVKGAFELCRRAMAVVGKEPELKYVKKAIGGGRPLRHVEPLSVRIHNQWIRNMVQQLLCGGDVSTWDLKARASFLSGLYGDDLDTQTWAALPVVDSTYAALLISGINPARHPDPERCDLPEEKLIAYRRCLAALNSIERDGTRRDLATWVVVAEGIGLDVDDRIRLAVLGLAASPAGEFASSKSAKATQKPSTRAERQAAAKDAMKKHKDNQTHAAKELDTSPKSLRRWLGIDGTKPRGPTKTGWGSQLIRKK